MQRALVLLPALCLVVAACGSSGSGAKAHTTTTEAPVKAFVPTSPTVPTNGKDSVYVLAVDPSAHTITVDPMQFLTGKAATAALKRMNPSASRGPLYDYALLNPTADRIKLPLERAAPVRVMRKLGATHAESISQAALAHYSGLGNRPFSITIVSGKVTAVDERFLP